ncbi:MAG: hypothetical protein R2754_00135 [Microthrixaceae bacterium]
MSVQRVVVVAAVVVAVLGTLGLAGMVAAGWDEPTGAARFAGVRPYPLVPGDGPHCFEVYDRVVMDGEGWWQVRTDDPTMRARFDDMPTRDCGR